MTELTHQLKLHARFGNNTRALIVDGHGTARQMLAAQLRAMGVSHVVQCAKAMEARQHAAAKPFEIVLCEQRLGDGTLGQDLIDDLRQRRLITLSTIVMVMSANSSYPVVAEAAELAIDGFLIKPYSLGDLEDRLLSAFLRKDAMREIALAIDRSDHAGALALCQQRFQARGPYWTHAARLGAELAIRLEHLPLATELFKAVIDDKAVPWARLGIARVMDASGKDTAAVSTIKNLLGSHPTYADAYDVLGRIYTDRGDYAAAAETFRRAVEVTPHSVARNQKYGILVYYTGDQGESMKILSQVVERGGLLSPDFDHHVVLLLAVDAFKQRQLAPLSELRAKLGKAIEEQHLLTAQAEVVRAPGAPPGQAWVMQRRLLRYLMLVDALAAVLSGDAVLAMERLEKNYRSLSESDAAVDAAADKGPARGKLACANLAHGFAAAEEPVRSGHQQRPRPPRARNDCDLRDRHRNRLADDVGGPQWRRLQVGRVTWRRTDRCQPDGLRHFGRNRQSLPQHRQRFLCGQPGDRSDTLHRHDRQRAVGGLYCNRRGS